MNHIDNGGHTLGAGQRGGEAAAARAEHGTWGAIKRHRNTREPLCDPCRDYQRTYNRDYATKVAMSPTELARRHRHRLQREAARRAVDPVAVERAADLNQPLPTLSRAEKACAYTVMMRRGVPRCRVVARLRISWSVAREFAGAA